MEDNDSKQDFELAEDTPQKPTLLEEWQKWVKAGRENYERYKSIVDKGDRLLLGEPEPETVTITTGEYARKKPRVNFIRRRINAGVDQVYSRNPRVTARAKKPYFIVQDPQTGAIQKVDERQFQTMPDPQTGQPITQETTQDISDQRAEVVEAVLNKILSDSDLKAEAKGMLREAHHRPAAWLEVGYEYSEANQRGECYFRWRSFKCVVVDPGAEIRDGVIRKCRYIAVRLTVTREEAEDMGLNLSALAKSKPQPGKDAEEASDDGPRIEADDKFEVYRLWDNTRRMVGYLCEQGDEWAKEPEEWPWHIDHAPFSCLKLAEDTDKQFSRPPILEAEYIQDELNQQRETLYRHVVNARPVNLYDPAVIDKEKVSVLAGRGAEGWVAIDGLSERPNAIQQFSDDALSQEFYAHYQRNENEMDMVLGVSANDSLQVTKATAAEVQSVGAASASQQAAKVDVLEDCLRRAIRLCKQIVETMYTEEQVAEVVGRDGSKYWVRWTGAEILNECDVDIEVGSTERRNDAAEKQLAVNMLNTMLPLGGAIDVPRLAVEILKKHGYRNAESYRMQPQPQQPQTPPNGPPAESDTGASAGSTVGLDPMQSAQDQVNPMK